MHEEFTPMRLTGFLVIYLFSFQFLFAQTDSTSRYPQKSSGWAEKASWHRKIAEPIIYTDAQKAHRHLDSAFLYIKNSNNKSEYALILAAQSRLMLFENKPEDALKIAEQAVEKSEKQEALARFRALESKGRALSELNRSEEALSVLHQCLELASQTNEHEAASKVATLILLGDTHKRMRDFKKSLAYYQEAAEYAKSNQQESSLGPIYNNQAIIYSYFKDYEAELDVCKLALRYYPPNDARRAVVYNNMANAFKYTSQKDSAVFYYNRILSMPSSPQSSKTIASYGLASLLIEKGQTERARSILLKAFSWAKESGSIRDQMGTLGYIGESYFQEKKYRQALEWYLKAEEALESTSNGDFVREKASLYASILQARLLLDKRQKEVEVFEKFVTIRDTINRTDQRAAVAKALAELNNKIQADSLELLLKDQTIKEAKLNQNRQLIIGLLLGLILLVVLAFFWRRNLWLSEIQKKTLEARHEQTLLNNASLISLIHELKTEKVAMDFEEREIHLPGRSTVALKLGSIVCVQSLGGGVRYETEEARHQIWQSLEQAKALLPEPNFIQVHRSYIINTKFVTSFSRSRIVLNGQIKIPIGITHRDAILEHLNARTNKQAG
ncbi:MAG: tetratricopeptide repeat protein [Saprospiraceae bacterium]